MEVIIAVTRLTRIAAAKTIKAKRCISSETILMIPMKKGNAFHMVMGATTNMDGNVRIFMQHFIKILIKLICEKEFIFNSLLVSRRNNISIYNYYFNFNINSFVFTYSFN